MDAGDRKALTELGILGGTTPCHAKEKAEEDADAAAVTKAARECAETIKKLEAQGE